VKVALHCHNFPPEFAGGTERVTLALARALQAAGDEVFVICGSDRPHAGIDVVGEQALGIRVHRIPRLPSEPYGIDLRRARILTLVEDLWTRHDVDVVHLHHWSTLSVRMLRSARLFERAAIATLHDLWPACPRFFRRPPAGIVCPERDGRDACVPCAARDLEVPIERLAGAIRVRDREVRAELAAAQFLCTPSAAAAAAIRLHVPWHGPIEVVPHGLLEPAPPAPAANGRGAGGRLRIGTFGNLVADKGVALLVEAMAGVPAELHLHGPFLDDAFRTAVERLAARAGVALHCHGPYAASGAHPAAALDLAVFPSLCDETYGLVVEEALARGVPAVVADAGALPERVAGGGGLVVPRGDVPALARTLARLAADPAELARLRHGIPARFATIADAARRYRELYAAALAQR
jgi:glycosyltransferase involved in cell wall biosynthesis